MIRATNAEMARLVMGITPERRKKIDICKVLIFFPILLLLVVRKFAGTNTVQEREAAVTSTCAFCNQSPPNLRHDKSYTIQIPNNNNNNNDHDDESSTSVVVTPMTISYDYELYDGQNLYTRDVKELIPNLEYDYAILGMSGFRNVDRETGNPVSLDEVYVHHFSLLPIHMLGAEVLTRNDDNDDPYMRFPTGYALHILADEYPYLETNAHLLSNKNLAPIGGSLERAHKECNECYYAPGKGSDCTPEVSGTFSCCGDSPSCMFGGEDCACAVTTTSETKQQPRTTTTTKYRIELDLLIAREVRKFRRVEQWSFAAPSCSININGDPVFERYPPDNYCYTKHNNLGNLSTLYIGGGSLFHQIPLQPLNEDPFVRTALSILAPTGGQLVWVQSHLHTGGVNATLYRNGEIVCATEAVYGTNSDASTNARDERGHLIRIASCYDQLPAGGIRFESGDVFVTESYYYGGAIDDDRLVQQQTPGIVGGEHKNVMSMFFTGVVLDGDADFVTMERTSFNLWNNFVPVAGVEFGESHHHNDDDEEKKQTGKNLRKL